MLNIKRMPRESQSLRKSMEHTQVACPGYKRKVTLVITVQKKNQTERIHTAGSPSPRRDGRLGIVSLKSGFFSPASRTP